MLLLDSQYNTFFVIPLYFRIWTLNSWPSQHFYKNWRSSKGPNVWYEKWSKMRVLLFDIMLIFSLLLRFQIRTQFFGPPYSLWATRSDGRMCVPCAFCWFPDEIIPDFLLTISGSAVHSIEVDFFEGRKRKSLGSTACLLPWDSDSKEQFVNLLNT